MMFGQNRQSASEACFFDKQIIITTKSDLTGKFLRSCLCCCSSSDMTVLSPCVALTTHGSSVCFLRSHSQCSIYVCWDACRRVLQCCVCVSWVCQCRGCVWWWWCTVLRSDWHCDVSACCTASQQLTLAAADLVAVQPQLASSNTYQSKLHIRVHKACRVRLAEYFQTSNLEKDGVGKLLYF